MKKIANLTLVIRNFGNKLQSYALCKAIESFNLVEPEVIRLSDGWGYGNVASLRKKQLLDLIKTYKLKSFRRMYDFIRFNLQYKQIRKNSDVYKSAVERQTELYAKFDNEIPYTPKEFTIADVRAGKLIPDYDAFIVGSDQVWNGPRVGCLDVYMCDFLHKKRSALSYAASFAIDAIPDNQREEYEKYIQNMDTLFIREERGVELCKELGRDDAKQVLDPSLLLEAKDYERFLKNPVDLVGEGEFVLVYSLTSSMKIFDEGSKLANKYHCKMVVLKNGAYPPLVSKYKNAVDIIAAGPAEFLSLVKYAKFIVTGSYHALMFSLLFHTNFYIYLDNASAQNSRLISTLKMFGLEKQLYYETSSLPKIMPHIDYSIVDPILKEKREESLALLRASIERKLQVQK
jgi:hypothetical protein